MGYNFKVAKDMARALASRFGIGYINYDGKNYYSTSCPIPSIIGKMEKGKFKVVKQQEKLNVSIIQVYFQYYYLCFNYVCLWSNQLAVSSRFSFCYWFNDYLL